MKYGIDIGHNLSADSGAASIREEDVLNKEVGLKVIDKLKNLGHEIVNCTPTSASTLLDSLKKRVDKANTNNVEFFVSIHFNAGGGRGTEVYAVSDYAKKIAKSIVTEISSLGYANRGVKDGRWLYVIKNTVAPAILVECAFIDSQEDMDRYDGESMANAIVKGLTGTLPQNSNTKSAQTSSDVKPNSKPSSSKNDTKYLQQVLNRLKIRDYSGSVLQEDGIDGARTQSAVKNFQSLVGLIVDGIAGQNTWKAINSILNKPYLKVGVTSEIPVKYLQWRIGTYVDGVFGELTKKSVINFQQQNNLAADGIVGPKTWEKLIE